MLNITELVDQLKDETQWQETPVPLTDEQYTKMIIRGLEKLFVDTGRAKDYDENKYQTVTTATDSYVAYDGDFLIDEKHYIMLCAQMNFFKKVQTDVNNTFGYSTDALTVTNADKPYANLKNTLEDLDKERRITYYKMHRYALGTE